MQKWVKGFVIVIVNGIVVGRYVPALGPQQALYLPSPWLQKGDNEIIVFEHSLWPASQIKYSHVVDPILLRQKTKNNEEHRHDDK
jgi:beta-galactosidase